jgi:hypothetical protein
MLTSLSNEALTKLKGSLKWIEAERLTITKTRNGASSDRLKECKQITDDMRNAANVLAFNQLNAGIESGSWSTVGKCLSNQCDL